MVILGIETSCDETAAAVVKDGKIVLSNVVSSSQNLHAKTGGIIPEEAARKQIEFIIPAVEKSLRAAKLNEKDIDAIAVTYGPGLIGSLLVGVETAKTLSAIWNKPLVPVNHLVAHLYANFISHTTPSFPAMGLVVSGGHSDLVMMNDHNNIALLGSTKDDAAGEAFDKISRLLGLGYPGGPAISKASKEINKSNNTKGGLLSLFPRPMIHEDNFDFSFSGLKTSVNNYVKKNPGASRTVLAAEVQEAIVDVLVAKSQKAVEKYKPKSFLLAGGVSANTLLRERIAAQISSKVYLPEIEYATDNAAMVASCAYSRYFPVPWRDVSANPELIIVD